MKNANGSGCVSKVKEKRRKPWKAIITSGREYDPVTDRIIQKRKLIGYYRTRTEAEDALSNYRQNPYDLDGRKITFAQVYDRWSAVHYEKISASKARAYKSAYAHATPLHGMKFADIRPVHIEKCMREAEDVGSSTKNGIKQLCGLLYKYAIKSELVTTNYAAMCDGVSQDAPTIIRLPFTAAEEVILWDNLVFPYVDMVLVGMYSGWRPQELVLLETAHVDLQERVMYGGIKTKAGKNRAVPIHEKVFPLVAARMQVGGSRLFLDKNGKPLTYGTYYQRFRKICDMFGFQHAPHDVRHTFVTKAKEAGMDEYILKLIVGHAIGDITEKVYTHRRLDELRREMKKIK